MNLLPSQWSAKTADEFIGPARTVARRVEKEIEKCRAHGRAPVKFIFAGRSGCGKTNLSQFAASLLGAGKWNCTTYNAADMDICMIGDIERSMAFCNLYGDYRIFRIEEAQRLTAEARGKFYTVVENAPNGNAFICSGIGTTAKLDGRSAAKLMGDEDARQFADAYQSRFQYFQIEPPTQDEIACFLAERFGINGHTAKMISSGCCGNVRAALMDAQMMI